MCATQSANVSPNSLRLSHNKPSTFSRTWKTNRHIGQNFRGCIPRLCFLNKMHCTAISQCYVARVFVWSRRTIWSKFLAGGHLQTVKTIFFAELHSSVGTQTVVATIWNLLASFSSWWGCRGVLQLSPNMRLRLWCVWVSMFICPGLSRFTT